VRGAILARPPRQCRQQLQTPEAISLSLATVLLCAELPDNFVL
jgi:hypothetical protein